MDPTRGRVGPVEPLTGFAEGGVPMAICSRHTCPGPSGPPGLSPLVARSAVPFLALAFADVDPLQRHRQVLRHRGLGQRQLLYDVTANTLFPPDEKAQNLDSSRMANGLGQTGRFFIGDGSLNWS